MSTVIDDHYSFNSLSEWELFYRRNKTAIDSKDTRWLNNHITITDNGKKYRIFFRKHKLFLKPYFHLNVESEKESIREHQLSLILEKLDELFSIISSNRSSGGSSTTKQEHIPDSLPHKSSIDRIQKVQVDKNESTNGQAVETNPTLRHLVSRLRTVPSSSKH